MVKLMICVISAGLLACCVLQMRQQKLNIRYQSNRLHDQIEASQARLWNQQLQIASYTAPNAVSESMTHMGLKMNSQKIADVETRRNWLERGEIQANVKR